jgi:hypothetical protein
VRSREGVLWAAARTKAAAKWTAERGKQAALLSSARAKEGAAWTAEHGKQAALLSGTRAREGALWTAARAKDGAAWSAHKIADSSRSAWENWLLPGMKRAGSGAGQAGGLIKSGGAGLAGRAREYAIAFGAWSANLPRAALAALLISAKFVLGRMNAVKDVMIDARKRHAEADVAAKATRKEVEKEGPAAAECQTEADAAKEADTEPASGEEQRSPVKAQKTLSLPAGGYVLDRVNAVKNVFIDARKRHAQAGAAARAARKEIEEEADKQAVVARRAKEAAEKAADTESASAENSESAALSKKKKKAKAKQDSVGV